jgi:hypothetical protein
MRPQKGANFQKSDKPFRQLINTEQAAEILGVTGRQCRHLAEYGRIPVADKGPGQIPGRGDGWKYDPDVIKRVAQEKKGGDGLFDRPEKKKDGGDV